MKQSRSTAPYASIFEALEKRTVLDGSVDPALTFVSRFPEGFASDTVSEYVSISNANNFPVQYEIHARYETGVRDQLVASGTIPALQRGGASIAVRGFGPETRLVRSNEPYSLILNSSAAVAGYFSHYDNDASVGESLTSLTSTEWTFADGIRLTGETRDYILVYNPNDQDILVQMQVYTSSGIAQTTFLTVAAQRRSGWSISDNPFLTIPEGIYGVRLTSVGDTSGLGFVASQSRYHIQSGRGMGYLGTSGGGGTSGIIGSVEAVTDPASGGVDPLGNAAVGQISILNTGATSAIIRFFYVGRNGTVVGDVDNPNIRTLNVPPNTKIKVDTESLGFGTSANYGLAWESILNTPVTVMAAAYQGTDGTGVESAVMAATVWNFGEGYMSQSRAGNGVTETIYVFNPSATAVTATFDFVLFTGTVVTVTRNVPATHILALNVHELPEIRDLAENMWFGLQVSTTAPVGVSMEHWDEIHAGGFTGQGAMSGTIVTVESIFAFGP